MPRFFLLSCVVESGCHRESDVPSLLWTYTNSEGSTCISLDYRRARFRKQHIVAFFFHHFANQIAAGRFRGWGEGVDRECSWDPPDSPRHCLDGFARCRRNRPSTGGWQGAVGVHRKMPNAMTPLIRLESDGLSHSRGNTRHLFWCIRVLAKRKLKMMFVFIDEEGI